MSEQTGGASAGDLATIEREITRLFSLVIEALAGATHALLAGEPGVGRRVVAADRVIDELTSTLDQMVWAVIDRSEGSAALRPLIGLLLMLGELERSADLAEHIAQRAVTNLGSEMSPRSRGIVQRMSEVALVMWHAVADAYADGSARSVALDDADDEMDELHERLTAEIAKGAMPVAFAAQVTLLARFYERLGDHAVNLAKRIEGLPPRSA